jgi:transcription initiation factor TFIIIB Brf1 subunit/transcription initiation factor TFIIB
MPTIVHEAVLMREYLVDQVPPLTGDEVWTYLAILTRLAALNGVTADEAKFIDRAAASLGLTPDVARSAHRVVVDKAVPTEKLVERIRDPALRLCLLRDAYRLAAADDKVTDAELRELGAIARALGLTEHTADQVRNVALQETALQREFARLVREVRV